MTPLLMTEATTARGGPAASASDETASKGDGGFADLVDAPATQDEKPPKPADDPSLASGTVDEDPSPAIEIAQLDVPLPPERAASNVAADSPKVDVAKVPDLAKEVAQPTLETDAEPEEKPQDAKPAGLPDKGTSAAKSAVQAIMEGRMPLPQADAGLKTVPQKIGLGPAESLPDAVEPETVPRVSAPPAADQPLQVKGLQAPNVEQSVAVLAEPKSLRDAERREASIDPTQQPTDAIKQPNGPPAPIVNTPVLASAPTIMLDLQKQAANQSLAEVDVLSGSGLGERAGASSLQSIPTGPAPITAQAGQQVAHQIATAITQNGGRATEIALNPEELGRVRLSITAQETTITLTVLAERPETTDLLRRNIDALAQEFRALGYEDINFSFGGDGAAQTETDDAPDQSTLIVETVDDSLTSTAQQPTSGLDLRM